MAIVNKERNLFSLDLHKSVDQWSMTVCFIFLTKDDFEDRILFS